MTSRFLTFSAACAASLLAGPALSAAPTVAAVPAQAAPAAQEKPALTTFTAPASQIAPPLSMFRHWQSGSLRPLLISTTPEIAAATPAAPDQPTASLTTATGAGSVIATPRPAPRQVAAHYAPDPATPTAVPFIGSPAPATPPKAEARPTTVAALPTKPAPAPAKAAPAAQAEPSAPSRDESQRVLLAKLENDLALASRRLDRARGSLTEGQRQLSDFTGVLQQAMLEAGPDARGLNPFVKVAQRYLGTPYVWGGASARGFDCSGFIIRVMHDLGYRALPHSAAEQFRYGIAVAQQILKPGDLVFFANTYKPGISHVGVYLGRRRFIHAANSNVGTIVSSLDEAKWRAKYAGARRLMPVKG